MLHPKAFPELGNKNTSACSCRGWLLSTTLSPLPHGLSPLVWPEINFVHDQSTVSSCLYTCCIPLTWQRWVKHKALCPCRQLRLLALQVCREGIAVLILCPVPISSPTVTCCSVTPRGERESGSWDLCVPFWKGGMWFCLSNSWRTQGFAALKVGCGYTLHFLPHLPSNLGINSKQKSFTPSWQIISGMGLWALNPIFTASLVSWMWVTAKPWICGGFQIHPTL